MGGWVGGRTGALCVGRTIKMKRKWTAIDNMKVSAVEKYAQAGMDGMRVTWASPCRRSVRQIRGLREMDGRAFGLRLHWEESGINRLARRRRDRVWACMHARASMVRVD